VSHHDLPRTTDAVHPPHRLLRVLRPLARSVLDRRFDVRVHGEDHVPRGGPVILVCNHIGLLDGPLLAAYAPRPVHTLTKEEMFTGATGRFLLALGQVPLARYDVDVTAVKRCVRVLRDGGVVGVFPEGTRGDGQVRVLHPGAAYLALVTGAPVIPIANWGTQHVVPPGKLPRLFPRRRVTVVAGPPVDLSRWAGGPRTRTALNGVTSAIMTEVTRLVGEIRGETPPAEPFDPAA